MESAGNLSELVSECQTEMAHAWVVRAFVRHSDEIDDYPELSLTDRAIFDIARALETRVDDPAGYFHMLRKKLGKYKSAVAQFANDAPHISSHTNFAQAVISLQGTVQRLEKILAMAQAAGSK